jgi:SAM-dependent methyltransferase
MTYVFGEEWHRERERLAGIEGGTDAVTQEILARTGVGAGWRCGEVGAGGGSVAAWLSDRVGPTGEVYATDLDTRFLTGLAGGNVQVLAHDFTTDEPPATGLDLVHARLVVEHVAGRGEALKRLMTWLRPGGWLVVEDIDWTTRFPVSRGPEFDAAITAALDVAHRSAGYDRAFGRCLPTLFTELGLADVDAQTHARLVRGGGQGIGVLKLTLERIAPATVAAGLLTDTQIAAALALCTDPTFATMLPTMVSVWGRVPGEN